MLAVLYVALGGGAGSVLRFLLSRAVVHWHADAAPLATLAVNLIGSVAMGYFGAWFATSPGFREEYRVALLTGLLGGFTTFSAYAWETVALIRGGHARWAILLIAATNVTCLAAAWLGIRGGTRGPG